MADIQKSTQRPVQGSVKLSDIRTTVIDDVPAREDEKSVKLTSAAGTKVTVEESVAKSLKGVGYK